MDAKEKCLHDEYNNKYNNEVIMSVKENIMRI